MGTFNNGLETSCHLNVSNPARSPFTKTKVRLSGRQKFLFPSLMKGLARCQSGVFYSPDQMLHSHRYGSETEIEASSGK